MSQANHGGFISSPRALAQESAIMSCALVIIWLFAQNTAVMTALIPLLIAGRFLLLYQRGDLAILILGVVAGGGNDLLSMWRGVYYYTPPTILPVPIPIWMLLFWGQIFVAFRRLMRLPAFAHAGAVETPFYNDLPMLLDLAWLLPMRLCVYSFAQVPWLPEAIIGAALLVRYLLLPPAPHERRLMLCILAIGPAYEIALIHAGLYVYQHGVVFGMPLWLIIYWAFIFRLLNAVVQRMEKMNWP